MDGRDTYKFDLVLLNENNFASPLMIGCMGNVHKCHMEVYIHLHLKPGYNVDWEKTTCPSRYNTKTNPKQDYNEQGEHKHNEHFIDHVQFSLLGTDYFNGDIMKMLCQAVLKSPLCNIIGGGAKPPPPPPPPATQPANQTGPQPPPTEPAPKPKSAPMDEDTQGITLPKLK